MSKLTITIPLSSIPGVTVEGEYEHPYDRREVILPAIDRLFLSLTCDVMENWDSYDVDDDFIEINSNQFVKMSKPRLVIK